VTKLRVELEEQTAADIHGIIKLMRKREINSDEDQVFDDRLRDVEAVLRGALRSVGWVPKADGVGWQQQPTGRRR
jgi:hypothetical protein